MSTADRDFMAAKAARKMAGGSASMNSTLPSARVPRSLPVSSQLAGSSESFVPAEALVTKPPEVTVAPTTSPATLQRDMGPPLKGDAARLKEAREFLAEVKTGTGQARSRFTSTRSVPSPSYAVSVPRLSRAHEIQGNGLFVAPMPTSASRAQAALHSPQVTSVAASSGSFTPLHHRTAPATFTPSIPSGRSMTNTALSNASDAVVASKPAVSAPSEEDTVEAITTSLKQASLTESEATEAPALALNAKNDKVVGLLGRQMTGIQQTMTGLAPHLRIKAAAATAAAVGADAAILPPTVGTASTLSPVDDAALKPSTTTIHIANPGTPAGTVPTFKQPEVTHGKTSNEEPKLNPILSKPSLEVVTHNGASPQPSAISSTTVTKPTASILDSTAITSVQTEQTTTTPAADGEGSETVIASLKQNVSCLMAKVEKLETMSRTMASELDALKVSEEQRRCLGTDSTKLPFLVKVGYPNNMILDVWVLANDRVSDLIRRALAVANLRLKAGANPRVTVNGRQVPHLQMLGLVGVTKDMTEKVEVKYGEVDVEDV